MLLRNCTAVVVVTVASIWESNASRHFKSSRARTKSGRWNDGHVICFCRGTALGVFSLTSVSLYITPSRILQEQRAMAPTPKKNEAQAYAAEVALVQLGNCMVNLPSALTAVLENENVVSICVHLI